MLNSESRTVEEGYASACASSDLRVEADRNGDADYMIAAGMNKSRFGALLLRFATEWDSSEKPRRPTPEAIEALARTYPVKDGKPTARQRQDAAREQAFGWYSNELELLAGKLKTLPQVRTQLGIFAALSGMEHSESKVPAVIGWWVHQQCALCSGVKELAVPNTGRLSGIACRACKGTGHSPVPYGTEGQILAGYMDECVIQARIDIKKRLRPVANR